MNRVALIGIGNPFRSDDGVGWFVVDTLDNVLPPSITRCKVKADPALLLHLFETHSTVFIVDATQRETTDAAWLRLDATATSALEKEKITSTHGITLREAIELARTLGQLPKQLTLYLIPAENFEPSNTLTPSVKKAAERLATTLKKELLACTKEAS